MKNEAGPNHGNDIDDEDGAPHLQHTGEQPFHRPPFDEPERVGEGELDIGAPVNDASLRERVWEGEADDEEVSSDAEND